MNIGVIGGILGGVLGLLGGIVGTYFSIRNARGPAARRFMIRAAVLTWIVVGVYLALLWIVPQPFKFAVMIPYGLLLGFGIRAINKRLAALEAAHGTPPSGELKR